ncbi:MAG: methyltransferase domain-containing protein [Treponema sp.]|nr:methyltransferase domain-containing protein [Treponema sp.]
MDINKSIDATRAGFEDAFASGDFYNKQTQDTEHLEKILRFIKIKEKMKILDLGAGSGYLSFPIAKNNPQCEVIGLDIVVNALKKNQTKANQEVLGKHDKNVIASYDLVETETELHITERVNNVLFKLDKKEKR